MDVGLRTVEECCYDYFRVSHPGIYGTRKAIRELLDIGAFTPLW